MTDVVKSRRADAQRNYDRLVQAARDTFAARGGDASMEEIAKTAGVGIGTLYRHFPKRIDVVQAVYKEDVDELVRTAEVLVTAADSWAALEKWLDAYVAYLETKLAMITELRVAFEKNPDLKLEIKARVEDATAMVLGRAQAEGKARKDVDANDVMQLIGGMCMGVGATPIQNKKLLPVILAGLRAE
jgi:AcrR family transcriptional regulator